jgi:transcription elongation factor GreB
MSRWRPPSPQSTAIITPNGYKALKDELDLLWTKERPEIVKALSAAAAEGDRSENAEYIYRKKQLGELDRRIRYLSKRLPSLRVARDRPTDINTLYFGAWFQLEDEQGITSSYRIVGPDELDPKKGWISIDSPLARAALKRRIDDEVQLTLANTSTCYTLIALSYDGPIEESQ